MVRDEQASVAVSRGRRGWRVCGCVVAGHERGEDTWRLDGLAVAVIRRWSRSIRLPCG
jgi:hypothetical protein